MDIATIAGLAVALGAILGGHVMEGGHLGSVMQPTAGLIVVVGTIGAVMVSFPMHTLIAGVKAMKIVFAPPSFDKPKLVEQLIGFATAARQNGIIAIEKSVADIKDPFLKKALNLAVDGSDSKTIRAAMELDLTHEEEAGEGPAKVWESVGGFAPCVGILGAVLGLIHVMENLSDPSKLGSGIAVAFVATVYGVGLANLIALPIANKLKLRNKEATQVRELMLDGVSSIVDGENPRLIKEKLSAYLGHDHHAAKEGASADKAAA